MTMRSWIRKLFTRRVTRPIRKAPRRTRLALERLEDRCCPSTFTVSNTLDDGSVGSLRWAVNQANTTAGGDTIAFDSTAFSTAKTITLGGTQLELSDTAGVTITGPTAGVTISGNDLSRVFKVDAGVTASFSGLKITGGEASSGGGVFNAGTLTLTDCTISGNTAQGTEGGTTYLTPGGNGQGGAVYNSATLTLTDCTLSGNSAQGGNPAAAANGGQGQGGAIFNHSTLTMTNCTLDGNTAQGGAAGGVSIFGQVGVVGNGQGGAIYNNSNLNLSYCTLSGNSAKGNTGYYHKYAQGETGGQGQGGAIFNNSSLTPTVTNCTLSGNTAQGGTGGGSYLTGGTGGQGRGGAVFTNSSLSLSNCTLSGNTAQGGNGGAYGNREHDGTPGNGGYGQGGAIFFNNNSALTVNGCTLSGNMAQGGAGALGFARSGTGGQGQGGAIFNNSSLAPTVTNCTLSSNTAKGGAGGTSSFNGGTGGQGQGGAVFSNFSLTLTDCTLSGNMAQGGAGANCNLAYTRQSGGSGGDGQGGGIFINSNSTLAVTDSTLSGNTAQGGNGGRGGAQHNFYGSGGDGQGGAIFNSFSTTLSDCTLSGNKAKGGAGGIVNRTSFGGFTSAGGLGGNGGNGQGGAIFNNNSALTLTDCTLNGNTAQGVTGGWGANGGNGQGGAIFNHATLTLTNCTLSGNGVQGGNGYPGSGAGSAGDSNGQGGAIFNAATLTLTSCTVSGNRAQGGFNPYLGTVASSGGGVFNNATAILTNTIVAGNTADTGPDVSGTVASHGHNLIGKTDGSSGWVGSDLTGTVAAPLNALLTPLGNYGGPTQTIGLLPGSPAINAGASGTGIPITDERGQARVGATDIGAFESQGFTLTPVAGSSPQSANIGGTFANPLAVTVAALDSGVPVNGGVITFKVALGSNGAGAFFLDPNRDMTVSATVASGQATAVTAAPNNAVGSFSVVASAGQGTTSLALTNTGTPFANLVVNTTSTTLFAGAGLLSLPLAVAFANSDGVASIITFDPTVFATPQTITLTGGQLALTDTSGLETITGPAGGVTISGGGLSRVFQVDAGVNAAFTGLTITGGSANSGGGLQNLGTLALTDCTVSGNSASGSGGGLQNLGTLTLTNCTVSANSASTGGGLVNTGTANLVNTIVAGNTAGTGPDVSGTVTSLGNNLIGETDGSSGWVGSDLTGTVAAPLNALLTPLGSYDGLAETMALLPGSPAIDAGVSGAGIPTTDERGKNRVGAPDIGAFESQGFTLTPVASSTTQTANIGEAFDITLDVTANNPLEPVNGGVVTYDVTPAANGAAVLFQDPNSATGYYAGQNFAATVANGQAGVAGPNNIDGSYTVEASASGASPAVTFALTNTGTPFTNLVVNTASGGLFAGAGLLSLPYAIYLANTDGVASTITFDPTVFATAQTITLTGGQLALTDTSGLETITGPAGGVTISGGGLSRVFQVDAGVNAAFTGLTITGGSASSGGGLQNLGTLALTDCTVSGNSASGSGGGLQNLGTLTLTNCTVSANSASTGGGLVNTGTANLVNTIVAGNTAGAGPDVSGTVTSLGNNLIGETDGSSGWVGSDLTGTVAAPLNALLAPLGSYDGLAETMALLPGSPAIDAGVSGAGIPSSDERGKNRVGATDIGAFESQGFTLTPVAGSTPQTSTFGIFNPLAVTVTANDSLEPVNGGEVRFIVPTTGASALLTPTVTIASGVASTTATVNGTIGAYAVTATAGNGANTVSFSLVNNEAPSLLVNLLTDTVNPSDSRTSLREAIAYAEFLGGNQTVTFDPTVFNTQQTIVLTGGQLDLTKTDGTLTIQGPGVGVLSISGNNASRVFALYGGSADVQDVVVTGGNSAGNGGGLYNNGGTLALTDVSVNGNTAAGSGGGLWNSGSLTLTNCTFSGDSAGSGGGLANANSGTATLVNCTFSGNSADTGGGVVNSGTFNLGNTIVAGNTASTGPDVSGTVTSLGNNLIGESDGSSGWVGSDLTGTVAAPLDARLRPLDSLHTLGLFPDSPALDAGNNALIPAGISTDERGFARIANGTVDIGAVEGAINLSFVVNTTSDEFDPTNDLTSLREAIFFANTIPDETITFDPTVFATPQTITLAGSQLELSDTAGTTTIVGPAGGVTISGGGLSRVFQIDAGVNASFSGLTITDGSDGGLANSGTLNLTSCTVSGNTGGEGGGLYNVGTAALTDCTISGNYAYRGDGLTNLGTLTLTNSTVSANTSPHGEGNGGGLYNLGTATLINSTVSGNSARYGDGLYNKGTLTLTSSTVSGNTSFYGSGNGGGLYNLGTATLTNCTVSGNSIPVGDGGGIFNKGTLTVLDSTLSGNSAADGGGLTNHYGTVTLTNCTLSGNRANGGDGGGMYTKAGLVKLTNCTISGNSGNSGAGLYNRYINRYVSFPLQLINTIVSGNGGINIRGSYTQQGPNLIGGNAMLSPLGNYGGPTQTMVPIIGSPVINPTNGAAAVLTTLRAAIPDAAATSITVASTAGLGAGLYFQIDSEIMLITGVTNGTTLTAERGVLGTTATAHTTTGVNVTLAADQRGDAYVGRPDIGAVEHQFPENLPAGVQRGIYVVNTTSDSLDPGTGLLSLPEAILLASGDGVASTITFDPTVFATQQTITDTQTGPQLTASSGGSLAARTYTYQVTAVTLNGEVAAPATAITVTANQKVTISWNAVPGAISYNIYRRVPPINPVLIASLSVTSAAGQNRTFTDAGITGSMTTPPFAAWLELRDTSSVDTIIGSAAGVTINGGGLGQVFQIDAGAAASISGLTITGANLSGTAGSALTINQGATLTLTNCTINANTGTAVRVAGTATLTDCTVSNNNWNATTTGSQAAGISVSGTAKLTNCTISGNSTTAGASGILAAQGAVTLTNCTVSGNTSTGGTNSTGGILAIGTVTLTNCTVSGNTSTGGTNSTGGILAIYGTFELTNTIVAGNTGVTNADVNGAFASLGNNLIGRTDGSTGWISSGTNADLTGTGTNPLDPKLDPLGLQSNGGPTQTIALLLGSPAVDAGASGTGIPPTDQRGYYRNGAVDIGAYEFGGTAKPPQTITFGPLADKQYGDADFEISATASSGLPVSFTASGDASVYQDGSGAWFVHITGAGSAIIIAHQAGNADYEAAPDVSQSLSIAQATLTVTSTADDGSVGTLRYAISQANTGNYKEIDFDIGTAGSSHTINLTIALPDLTASGVYINGLSQNVSGKAFQLITLNGTGAGASDGLLLQGSNCTVAGLILENFADNGIEVEGANNTIGGSVKGAGNVLSGNGQDGLLLDSTASGTTVQGNYIGLNSGASVALANGSNGIEVQSDNNSIGGNSESNYYTRNFLSGNGNDGVFIDSGATGNVVQGNFIGVNITGTVGVGNAANGIEIAGSGNTIGGTVFGLGNVLSGNKQDGVLLDGTTSSDLVVGNYVGVDYTGKRAVDNSVNGIEIAGSSNTVGGTASAARNIIAANSKDGAKIDTGASSNQVLGNSIGINAAGTALGNSIGIEVAGTSNTIGGVASGSRNIISGNSNDGVLLDSIASSNLVLGDYIGTNVYGTAALGNSVNGIELAGTSNTLGGTAQAARNVISANGNDGVLLDSSASGNQLMGNYIGTDTSGMTSLANQVGIEDAGINNTLGGSVLGARNIISGNTSDGALLDSSATVETVEGNFMGLNGKGTAALANGGNGIEVQGSNSTIGGNSGGNYYTRNFISGNGNDGVWMDSGASGNLVLGNFIGVDISGLHAAGNVSNGIEIAGNSNTVGGTIPGMGNVISGNHNNGVLIDSTASANLLQGNDIGTDYTGRGPTGNSVNGIEVIGVNNSLGGTTAGAGNVIASNSNNGVQIDSSASGTLVQGNYIGTNAAGASLGNGANGVSIASNNNTIGGNAYRAANTIAHNTGAGVLVNGGTGNSLLRNSTFANTGLGISLTNGGNNNVLAPSITSASYSGGRLTMNVSFDAPIANVSYAIELFASPDSDEGAVYLGTVTLTPKSTGTQSFTYVATTTVVTSNAIITATITDSSGDTSEFSPGVSV